MGHSDMESDSQSNPINNSSTYFDSNPDSNSDQSYLSGNIQNEREDSSDIHATKKETGGEKRRETENIKYKEKKNKVISSVGTERLERHSHSSEAQLHSSSQLNMKSERIKKNSAQKEEIEYECEFKKVRDEKDEPPLNRKPVRKMSDKGRKYGSCSDTNSDEYDIGDSYEDSYENSIGSNCETDIIRQKQRNIGKDSREKGKRQSADGEQQIRIIEIYKMKLENEESQKSKESTTKKESIRENVSSIFKVSPSNKPKIISEVSKEFNSGEEKEEENTDDKGKRETKREGRNEKKKQKEKEKERYKNDAHSSSEKGENEIRNIEKDKTKNKNDKKHDDSVDDAMIDTNHIMSRLKTLNSSQTSNKSTLKEGSLLRLFRCEYFDTHLHMRYLYDRKEMGVHEYLVNSLYTQRNYEDILFYLPQLSQISLVRYENSSLYRFLLDKASKSMHFALKLCWLYQSIVEDNSNKYKKLAHKMIQEIEMAVVNCKPLNNEIKNTQKNKNSFLLDLANPLLFKRRYILRKIRINEKLNEVHIFSKSDHNLFHSFSANDYIRTGRYRNSVPQNYVELMNSEKFRETSPEKREESVEGEREGKVTETDEIQKKNTSVTKKKDLNLTPKLPSCYIINSGALSLGRAKVKLPSTYSKLGNPLCLSKFSLPDFNYSYGMIDELQQFFMKQRRCDYFSLLNNFISLIITVSNLLAAEPDIDIRNELLKRFIFSLNSWMLMRRCIVASCENLFTMTGLCVPLENLSYIKQDHIAVANNNNATVIGAATVTTNNSSSSTSSNSTNNNKNNNTHSSSTKATNMLNAGYINGNHGYTTINNTYKLNYNEKNKSTISESLFSYNNLQILHFNQEECKIFFSKKRAPYLLVFEVADLDEDISLIADELFYQNGKKITTETIDQKEKGKGNGNGNENESEIGKTKKQKNTTKTEIGAEAEEDGEIGRDTDKDREDTISSVQIKSEQEYGPRTVNERTRQKKNVLTKNFCCMQNYDLYADTVYPNYEKRKNAEKGNNNRKELNNASNKKEKYIEEAKKKVVTKKDDLNKLKMEDLYVYKCIVNDLRREGLVTVSNDDDLTIIKKCIGLKEDEEKECNTLLNEENQEKKKKTNSHKNRGMATNRSASVPTYVKSSMGKSNESIKLEETVGGEEGRSNDIMTATIGGGTSMISKVENGRNKKGNCNINLHLNGNENKEEENFFKDSLNVGLDDISIEKNMEESEKYEEMKKKKCMNKRMFNTEKEEFPNEKNSSKDEESNISGHLEKRENNSDGGGIPLEKLRKMDINEFFKPENYLNEEFKKKNCKIIKKLLWGELFEEKKKKIRKNSPYGKLQSWDLKCVIVKGGDDLRQELLASQLIKHFKNIFENAGLPLWLRPYEILVTGSNSGIIEFVNDTCSVDSLKRKFGTDNISTIFNIVFADYIFEAKKNFIESHAAYSLISYLLQVKDRHNGNMLLDADGHLIHIDYGFMLTNSPGNVNFETSPFKLTQEYLDIMDGEKSDNYEYFRRLIISGFLEARKHLDEIVLFVELMMPALKMPCFSSGAQFCIDSLKERFMTNLTVDVCVQRVNALIEASINNFRSVQYDYFQKITNGIL